MRAALGHTGVWRFAVGRIPGAVLEGSRGVWELRRTELLDGGHDDIASTQNDNRVFQVQGLFVP